MKVSVFGNADLKEDSLVVEMVPVLRKEFPEVEFKIEDPSEGLNPPSCRACLPAMQNLARQAPELWVILDVGKGVNGVKVFDDLGKLVDERRVSLHDYDVAMELKLLRKIGRVGKVKIIVAEMGMEREKAERAVIAELKKLVS